MTHDHSNAESGSRAAFFTSRVGLALMGILAITGTYLWAEHRAHLLGALLWLPLLACPLIHLFMHRGHGGHGEHTGSSLPPRDGAS